MKLFSMNRRRRNLSNCIAVPVYKPFEDLTKNELASFNQLIKILGKHPIFLFGSTDFDFKPYIEFASKRDASHVDIKVFDSIYFHSIDGYNNLLKSYHFYKSFREFDYMLIHQLDAYVFKDELDYWCSKGFDYIGAPWLRGNSYSSGVQAVEGVGNGGFCLRTIPKCQKIAKKIERLRLLRNIWYVLRLQSIFRIEMFIMWFFNFSTKHDPLIINRVLLSDTYKINEDEFWSLLIPKIFNYFIIAPVKEALKFGMEVNSDFLFSLNQNNLPFGCHAWEKYEPDFWKEFIRAE